MLTFCYAFHEVIRRHAITLQDELLVTGPGKKPTLRPEYLYTPDQPPPSISKRLFHTDNRMSTKDQSGEIRSIQVRIPLKKGQASTLVMGTFIF